MSFRKTGWNRQDAKAVKKSKRLASFGRSESVSSASSADTSPSGPPRPEPLCNDLFPASLRASASWRIFPLRAALITSPRPKFWNISPLGIVLIYIVSRYKGMMQRYVSLKEPDR